GLFAPIPTFKNVFVHYVYVYARIEIEELIVPESIQYTDDDSSETILDCNYIIEEEDINELEVKWYHNSDTPIYEWIPSTNKSGEARGAFKSHVDLTYKITEDKSTMYRALKLRNITTDLTGNYTCKVSGFGGEDLKMKQMVVYSPAKSGVELMVTEANEIICSVEGIFPKPDMEIFITGNNATRIDLDTITELDTDEFGFYNITKHALFENLTELNDFNPVIFVCRVDIPGTNYSLVDFIKHYTEVEAFASNEEEDYFIYGLNSTEETFNMTTTENSAIDPNVPTRYSSTLLLILIMSSGNTILKKSFKNLAES
ncbi:hypothetical protein NQ317_012848, partial [Molorchus minor]